MSPFRNILLRIIHCFFTVSLALNISKFCSHLVEEFVIPSLHLESGTCNRIFFTVFNKRIWFQELIYHIDISLHWFWLLSPSFPLVLLCPAVLHCQINMYFLPQPNQLLSADRKDPHRISLCDYIWSLCRIIFCIHCHSHLRISYETFTESYKDTLRGFIFTFAAWQSWNIPAEF